MNEVSNKQKDSVLKTLAIAGFIGIIILVAWLAIQLVNIMPGAFGSLASLADGVNQYQQSILDNEDLPVDLTVTSNATLVNAGGEANLSWDTTDANGTYAFSYECTDGIAVDIRGENGLQSVACGTNYNIGDTDSLSIIIDSEKERYADLAYTVAFLGTNDREPRASGSATITVVNGQIVDSITEAEVEPEVVVEPSETEVTPEPEVEVVTETPTEPATPVDPTPVYEQEYVYEIPVSDPNGRTDLAVRFIAVGDIVGNTFFPGEIVAEDGGAIQFEVKNYGTKTSEEWEFSVTLPNGGTYTADDQTPLKPNERAVLTIGFAPSDTNTHDFVVRVDVTGDRSPLNDAFSQTIDLK